ncbi:peptidyl-glycine alpha-amidating monooxygenase B isoform X2 [Oncorhynchus kisutch]|uniref:Peptidylglycine alpha-amidating monooxygenase n=1 Tax=Oncorhynchus kisutch TaxID=8019 RepID=A0A8C7LH47_ONCKI|nr:peptidyl-glycine alpha-amidating monooxygenase isoform X2 [Oncorhynchus kisutch]XP_031658727.1 peptidyl-glycine alpha-amidating monooxygenase isoform X2 [Oncorhynchus kisutch]
MGVLVCGVVVLTLICQSHSLDGATNPLHRFKRYQESASSEPNDCTTRTGQPMVLSKSGNFSLDVRMPGVSPTVSDTYLCVAVPVPTTRDAYIVDFEPHASMDTAHHMLLYGCRTPVSTTNYWDCGSVKGTCEDEASIMYAWARNAPPTRLPPDVGFKVGGKSRITYFVLQIHYGDVHAFSDHHRDCSGLTLRMTSKPQPFIAGMYLMMSVTTVIPPGNKVTNADVACTYNSYPIYPFAFRTHTHKLGQVVSGYRIRDGKWTLIGRQTPQLPQAFYPATKGINVKYGDTLAARCVFTGEGRTTKTYIGGTSDDEMCNFYMMYYMESRHAAPFQECMEDGSKELFQNIPPEANVPITVPPEMMMHNMMHSAGAPSTPEHQDDMALLQPKREEEEVLDQEYHLEEVTDWPESPLQLGQVSGLALDSDDNLVIFHRGDHQWGVNSFDNSGKYQQQSLGPIQQSTILVVDPVKGSVLKASGRNMFYLPHGITTDKDNNYWVTDVALHQVFKLSSDGRDKPLVVLGEAFEPGSDKEHFCKPTDVAVDPVTGNVYVSDGYCNARILKFSPEGKYLSHWGAGSSDRRRRVQFRIPHSLVFLPDRRELCVADRENGRIQCFVAESGEFVKEIKKQEFGGEVFAISYAPVHGGLIYAVNGESAYGRSAPLKGFVINYSTKEILDDFSPENAQEFGMPHDIVVTKDGRVFVGDAATDSVLKFSSDKAEHRSVKKGGIEVQEIEETETIIQTRLKPQHRVEVAVAKVQIPVATQQKTAEPVQEQPQKPQQQEDDKEKTLAKQSAQGVSPAVITTLLLIPLVVVISIGVLIRYRKNRMYGDGCEVKLEQTSSGGILGKLRGKAAGGLNLGNFFATHKGYTRQGFDRLSTEGSDQEKDDDNDTDSENEEYSAPPPPVGPSSSS